MQLVDFDWYPEFEFLDYMLFSPLHSQVHSELGSSYNTFQPGSSDFSGNNNNSFQSPSQYGTNVDTYISEFLDSILENPDEVPPEKQQSWFDGAAQDQVHGVSSKLITSFYIFIKKKQIITNSYQST